jgi:hypothetical protein
MILTVNISIPLFKIGLLCFQNLMNLDFFSCSVVEPYNFYAAPTHVPNLLVHCICLEWINIRFFNICRYSEPVVSEAELYWFYKGVEKE